ncbi:catalase family protein [Paraburkholderia nemoris]|uniref:catalase family protein n=1 Tax=Paraburkholderia nemoris TaxID=2793076 RepID=UPI0038BC34EA
MNAISPRSNRPPYPSADEELGEVLRPDEEMLAFQLADVIERGVRAQYQPGNARRDVHSKATGCVKAEFRVNDALPESLAKGIFIPGKTYQAWIRFSNGSGDPTRSDDNDDGRGMAIKVLGVSGFKLLENARDATTQDFVMINHPVFLTNDPHRYLSLVEKAGSGSLLTKLTIPLTLGLKGTLLAKELNSGKIANPLQIRYWSAVPYQLGTGPQRQVVKFSVKPDSPATDSIPENPGHHYLREAMQATLRKGDVFMKFLVQPRNSDSLSVEDSMIEWDEAVAPFYEVATIHIPQQEFATSERERFGESLSFNPWHSLPEHRPLGVLNRLRKIVYDRISRVRHEMNSVDGREP